MLLCGFAQDYTCVGVGDYDEEVGDYFVVEGTLGGVCEVGDERHPWARACEGLVEEVALRGSKSDEPPPKPALRAERKPPRRAHVRQRKPARSRVAEFIAAFPAEEALKPRRSVSEPSVLIPKKNKLRDFVDDCNEKLHEPEKTLPPTLDSTRSKVPSRTQSYDERQKVLVSDSPQNRDFGPKKVPPRAPAPAPSRVRESPKPSNKLVDFLASVDAANAASPDDAWPPERTTPYATAHHRLN